MRRSLVLLAPLGLLSTVPAHADGLSGGRASAIELEHRVHVYYEDGLFTFDVVRRVHNNGRFDDELVLDIDIPEGGVVAGLWTHQGDGWRPGSLEAADVAQERYHGDIAPKSSPDQLTALAEWSHQGGAELRIFPVRGHSEAEVLYRVQVPVERSLGRMSSYYPFDPEDGMKKPRFVLPNGVSAEPCPEDDFDCDGFVIHSEPDFEGLLARLSALELPSGEETVVRLDLDVGSRLVPNPKNLSIVFVVDRSRSLSESGMTAQLQVLEAIISHVPDAWVQIVAFDRFAEPLLPDFVSAERAESAVDALRSAGAFSLANGSNINYGLAVAVDQLETRPSPRRIVFLSDGHMPSDYDASAAGLVLSRTDAITVLGAIPGDARSTTAQAADLLGETRVDEATLSPLATQYGNGGIVLELYGLPTRDTAALADLALGLVRPVRIDHFLVEGLDLDLPEQLKEGEGYSTDLLHKGSRPDAIVLRGQLWSRPFTQRLPLQDNVTPALASSVFANGMFRQLDDSAQWELATRAQVLSPVTSFLVASPSVRAPPRGLLGLSGFGVGCSGTCGGSSCSMGRLGAVHRDLMPIFDKAAAPCFQRHEHDQAWRLSLEIETHWTEVAAVRKLRGSDDDLARCIEEQLWALQLNPSTFFKPVEHHDLSLP